MNEKAKIVRFRRASGIALIRGRDGKLQVAHVMTRRLRRLRNNSIISVIVGARENGEIR